MWLSFLLLMIFIANWIYVMLNACAMSRILWQKMATSFVHGKYGGSHEWNMAAWCQENAFYGSQLPPTLSPTVNEAQGGFGGPSEQPWAKWRGKMSPRARLRNSKQNSSTFTGKLGELGARSGFWMWRRDVSRKGGGGKRGKQNYLPEWARNVEWGLLSPLAGPPKCVSEVGG